MTQLRVGRTVASMGATTAPRRQHAVPRRSLGDRILTRVVNPLVAAVLRSPVHDLVSERLVLLEYTGHWSGRTFALPVSYVQDGEGLTIVSRRRRRWWRNFREPSGVCVTLRGARREGGGVVVPASRADVAALLRRLYAGAGRPIDAARAFDLAAGKVLVHVELHPPHDEPAPLTGRALWRRWTAVVTAGEAAAFALPAMAGALLAAYDPPFAMLAAVVLVAGAAEGAVLGLAQAIALRSALASVSTRSWVRATTAGALVAWMVGLIPFGVEIGDRDPWLLVAAGVPLGLVLLTAMGVLQARVLRGHVERPRRWIAATAAAWAAGLTAFASITSPLWHEGQPVFAVAGIGILGGLVMAATVAAISGLALVRLVPRRRTSAPPA